MFTCLAPRTIHLTRQFVSFLQSVIWSSNHSSAIRARGSVYGATALTDNIGMAIGTFEPMTCFEVHGCYDLSFFFRGQRRESRGGPPEIEKKTTSSTCKVQLHVSREIENKTCRQILSRNKFNVCPRKRKGPKITTNFTDIFAHLKIYRRTLEVAAK